MEKPSFFAVDHIGTHLLVEFFGCAPEILTEVDTIERTMLDAALAAKATIITHNFHQFEPQGVSGVVVLAESHLSIHTWPEHGYAAVDLFTCGDHCKPMLAAEHLAEHLKATSWAYHEFLRGLMNGAKAVAELPCFASGQGMYQRNQERELLAVGEVS